MTASGLVHLIDCTTQRAYGEARTRALATSTIVENDRRRRRSNSNVSSIMNEEQDLECWWWSTLESPLCDIFLSVIVPKFLSIQDLINLSEVSHRYHELFQITRPSTQELAQGSTTSLTKEGSTAATLDGSKTKTLREGSIGKTSTQAGKVLLASILKRDAVHRHITQHYHDHVQHIDQLPTYGSCRTPEQALLEDPLLVATLRSAALRRRRLINIRVNDRITPTTDVGSSRNNNENDDSNVNNIEEETDYLVNGIISKFRAKPRRMHQRIFLQGGTDRRRRIEQRHHQQQHSGKTRFICVNETSIPIYCHWINFDGQMLVRDGDCIPPLVQNQSSRLQEEQGTASTTGRTSVLMNTTLSNDMASNIFSHESYINHSFALCLEEGGRPFAIYQIRRCYFARIRTERNLNGGGDGNNNNNNAPLHQAIEHCHAIAIVPNVNPNAQLVVGDGNHLSNNIPSLPGHVCVEELHCNMVRGMHRRHISFDFHFYDRQTGTKLPVEYREGDSDSVETPITRRRITENIPTLNNSNKTDSVPTINPKSLAKLFYGYHIPRSNAVHATNANTPDSNTTDAASTNYHPIWQMHITNIANYLVLKSEGIQINVEEEGEEEEGISTDNNNVDGNGRQRRHHNNSDGDDDLPLPPLVPRNLYRDRVECLCRGPLYFPASVGEEIWDDSDGNDGNEDQDDTGEDAA